MKKATFILGLLFIAVISFGQKKVEENIKVKDQKKVKLDFEFAEEIKVSGWEKDEILIKVSVNINDNEDNEHFELKINEDSDKINITSDIREIKEITKNKIVVHKSENGERTITYNNHYDIDFDIYFEVFVPKNMEVELSSITGDIFLSNLKAKLDIETISGFIDLTVKENESASIKTSTISGGIYSDHKINLKQNNKGHEMKIIVRRSPKFNINNGGRIIDLKTISGDIYIRK